MGGVAESMHGHDWRVTVCLRGKSLNEDGVLCDFHPAKEWLETVVGRFNNRCLNEVSPFDEVNPTAELVAKHICDEMNRALPEHVAAKWVRVTESPGCAAMYRVPKTVRREVSRREV